MGEKKLAGQVAMVTGAARGIGRATALRLAGLGADIAVVDRDLNAAQVYEEERDKLTAPTVMEECQALGVRAIGIQADLTDRTAAEKAAAEVVEKLGRIDIAACIAGGAFVTYADEPEAEKSISADPGGVTVGKRAREDHPVDTMTTGTTADCPEDMLRRVIDVNLYSCMYTCMAVAPYMKQKKSGRIVTTSSLSGIKPQGEYHPYGTAKAAIYFYTRALAQELAPFNINVNTMVPGLIRTGRFGDRSEMAKGVPLGREGTPEDCAKIVEFLVTDLSDYVTGAAIVVDGGASDALIDLHSSPGPQGPRVGLR
jgi:3-oxoacyl-[acyl-carrier protein] reductase